MADIEQKIEEIKEKTNLSEYTTFIGFGITVLVFIGINILGQVFNYNDKFEKFKVIDWIVFVVSPIITAIVGSIAKGFLKKQGVNNAYKNENVKAAHNEYMFYIAEDESYNPKHWKEQFKVGSIKGFVLTSIMSIGMSVLFAFMSVDFNITKLLSMFITLGMWVAFGILDMSNMYTYVTTEQIGWYKREIEKINKWKGVQENGTEEKR